MISTRYSIVYILFITLIFGALKTKNILLWLTNNIQRRINQIINKVSINAAAATTKRGWLWDSFVLEIQNCSMIVSTPFFFLLHS